MQGQVNNAFYEKLKEGWYEDNAHPIALLRAENNARNPWIAQKIHDFLGGPCAVLDIGCGAGFLSNLLATQGHQVTGVDLSETSLDVARVKDATKSVCYMTADALALPFATQSFDVICAMDFLEHVENPCMIVQKIGKLLRPGGLFFFHTFNRNWLSYITVIKGVEWFVPNTPRDMHVYSYFIKPQELTNWCANVNMQIKEMHGFMPKFISTAFWKSFFSRKVNQNLKFEFCKSLSTGYLGFAQLFLEE